MNFCLGPFARSAKARVGLGQLKSEGSKWGPFALVAAARLRCCCNLRKSKGRLRPTHKRGKQMEAHKRPLLLAIATQRQKGKRGKQMAPRGTGK
jgi:hypothetical protein